MLTDFRPLLYRRATWLLLLAYSCVTLPILGLLDNDTPYIFGADAATWIEPAKAWIQYGGFVHLHAPDIPNLYRPPILPVFNALFLTIDPVYGFKLIVLMQIFILAVTALICGTLAYLVKPAAALPAMVLLLFNPNSLGSAFLIQSETLFTFFLTVTTYSLFKSVQTFKFTYIFLCGMSLALTTLCRPTTQYLFMLFPVIFLVLSLIDKGVHKSVFSATAKAIMVSVFAFFGLILPWMMAVAEADGKYALAPSEAKSIYIYDQLLTLTSYSAGISVNDADKLLNEGEAAKLSKRCWALPEGSLDRSDCFRQFIDQNLNTLSSFPFTDYLRAWSRSVLGFYTSGGAGNWQNILSLNDGKNAHQSWLESDQKSGFSAYINMLSNLNLLSVIISGMCVIFSVCMKIGALAGLWQLVHTRNFTMLVMLVGLLSYFTVTTLFLGQSRYRVPLEPSFAILASFGLILAQNIWLNFSKKAKIAQ